jgi:hypothetical protein
MNAPPENPVGQAQAKEGRPRLEPDSMFVEMMPRRADQGRTMTAQASLGGAGQRLIPRRPPGRCNRKAGTFSAEVRRLRAEGYSFEVIREALAGAGVVVSNSTVQREAARRTSLAESAPASDPSP